MHPPHSPLHSILDFLKTTWKPPPNASTRQVRKAGAVMFLLGLLMGGIAVGAMALAAHLGGAPETAGKVTLPLWTLAFGGLIIGSFRLLLAADPDDMNPAKRMALGVLFGCGSLVLLAALVIVGVWALTALH